MCREIFGIRDYICLPRFPIILPQTSRFTFSFCKYIVTNYNTDTWTWVRIMKRTPRSGLTWRFSKVLSPAQSSSSQLHEDTSMSDRISVFPLRKISSCINSIYSYIVHANVFHTFVHLLALETVTFEKFRLSRNRSPYRKFIRLHECSYLCIRPTRHFITLVFDYIMHNRKSSYLRDGYGEGIVQTPAKTMLINAKFRSLRNRQSQRSGVQ